MTVRDEGFIGRPQAANGNAEIWERVLGWLDAYLRETTTKGQDYKSSITAKLSPTEAFEKISRISEWWTAGVPGDSRRVGDRFTVRFGETVVTFKVIELVPNERAVWLVTDCNLHWINKAEWKDTKLV